MCLFCKWEGMTLPHWLIILISVLFCLCFSYGPHFFLFNCVDDSTPNLWNSNLTSVPSKQVLPTTKPFLNDPSAGSPTDTLLRLLLPLKQGIRGSFQAPPFSVSQSQPLIICFISRSDGRCVQRAGTYSSQPDELQLQGIPRS